MRIMALILIIHFWAVQLNGQCNYVNTTFKSGEKVTYNVFYRVGFLWFNAANAYFQTSDTVINNKKAYKFYSYGATEPNYDWIFKVRDEYFSCADIETLSPLYFSRKTSEGSYKVNNQYNFNYQDSVVYSKIENSKKPLIYDTLKLSSCTLDVLAATYACRTVNLNTLKPNDTIPLKMLIDNEYYDLYLRYLKSEIVILENGFAYRCRKFSILLVEGSIFSGGENLYVWISDDNAKIPIKIEAKILVGSIIVQVNTIEGNKWPLSSRMNINIKE